MKSYGLITESLAIRELSYVRTCSSVSKRAFTRSRTKLRGRAQGSVAWARNNGHALEATRALTVRKSHYREIRITSSLNGRLGGNCAACQCAGQHMPKATI